MVEGIAGSSRLRQMTKEAIWKSVLFWVVLLVTASIIFWMTP